MLAIAKREFASLFASPLAWITLAVAQCLLAYIFLRLLQAFAQTQGQLQGLPGAPGLTRLVAMPLFETCAFILMVLVPLLTMRLIAEERRARTLALLLSAPVTSAGIVLGKLLGALAFLLILIALTVAMPLSLTVGTSLDFGQLGAGIVGLVLVATMFTAIGIYMSTLTSQPPMAAVGAFGTTLLLWMLDWGADRASLFEYLSVLHHFRALLRGLFDTQDIAYFLIVSIGFLYLSTRRISALRSPL
jgi:ABC-2 type transport system permease protein